MNIDNFEIDMLDVKAADACLIRFWLGKCAFVVLVDAGNYSDGEKVSEFIRSTYDTNTIDLAICTHCDDDHFGGFIYLLEQMRENSSHCVCVKRMIVNDPGKHVRVDSTKWYTNQENLEKEARSVFTLSTGQNLFDELEKSNVPHCEGFSDGYYSWFEGLFEIVGPTEEYYESLVYNFRNKIQSYDDEEDIGNDVTSSLLNGVNTVSSKTLDDALDDTSAHNQSSIILLFRPSEQLKYLFMGDAGREAVDKMLDSDKDKIKDVFWLKVPHHGSKHNMDSAMINHINPKVAYISTEKIGHYLSQATVNALKKKGATVYSTHKGGSTWHAPYSLICRSDYSAAIPL